MMPTRPRHQNLGFFRGTPFWCLGAILLWHIAPVGAQWKPAGDNLKTVWGEKLDPNHVWPEYPRPAFERAEWQNLNGLWDYALTGKTASEPTAFDGKVLVPFCPESSLSGVGRAVKDDQTLWYEREFTVPTSWIDRRVKLNFGAVDWKTEVFINGVSVGTHEGGYTPFSFDITPQLQVAAEQRLVVKVWDPTNASFHPVGKQRLDPLLIWYTPVSGIWQTVWLEPVASAHLESVVAVADIDHGKLVVHGTAVGTAIGDRWQAVLKDGVTIVATGEAPVGSEIPLSVLSPKLWNTQHPFLYGLDVTLLHGSERPDQVHSYAAMRKIAIGKDRDGFVRIELNDHPIFPLGLLDQGWWPDGLYTPPSDEAVRYDVDKTKAWGFNTIRKNT